MAADEAALRKRDSCVQLFSNENDCGRHFNIVLQFVLFTY